MERARGVRPGGRGPGGAARGERRGVRSVTIHKGRLPREADRPRAGHFTSRQRPDQRPGARRELRCVTPPRLLALLLVLLLAGGVLPTDRLAWFPPSLPDSRPGAGPVAPDGGDADARGARNVSEHRQDATAEDHPAPVSAPATAVLLQADGVLRSVHTTHETVGEVLAASHVSLGELDRVHPPYEDRIDGPTLIVVQRVQISEQEVDTPIGYDELRRETPDLAEGEQRLERDGQDGLRRQVFEVTFIDGVQRGRELVAEQVVREPTDRLVLVGTGPSPLREAQALLDDLGYPAGPVDGIDGPKTRRGLCAWRRLEGHDVSREPLQAGELEALRATAGLPQAPAGRGVLVDRTCQTLVYRAEGTWQAVYAASTGIDGLPGVGSYHLRWTRPGWHTSTLYPAPEPNMYNSMYFHGAIAIHGARHVPPRPASAGCVRVTPEVADRLYADLAVGDPVEVVGSYR